MNCKDCNKWKFSKNYKYNYDGRYGICEEDKKLGIEMYRLDDSECNLDERINLNNPPEKADKYNYCPKCDNPLYYNHICCFCGQKILVEVSDEQHNSG